MKPLTILAVGAVSFFVQAWLIPTLKYWGFLIPITVEQHNTAGCKPVPGLEACEDQWIHRSSGLSYLPCSTIAARQLWVPATNHLNASVDDLHASDEVFLFDTNTYSVSPVKITNRPAHLTKMHLHALDGYVDPKDENKVTFFLNNHAVPAKGQDPKKVGADSSVEIFESRLGSTSWTWVASVKHPLVDTPNNLVAVGHRQFYVTNDHPSKRGLNRVLGELSLPGGASAITFCDASSSSPDCMEAAAFPNYPNGIARGPDSTLYVGSSALGTITAWMMQADHTLVEGEQVANLQMPIDNIHVTEKGEIIAATIPIVVHFMKRGVDGHSPSEAVVWRVKNQTTDEKMYGSKYMREQIFADASGRVTPGLTNAQLYNGKLYLTGITTPTLVECPFEN